MAGQTNQMLLRDVWGCPWLVHAGDELEPWLFLPTHSYMKYLYKYSQAAFPHDELVETNKRRNRGDMEYELLDTGIFDGDRYFDVFVEYAKQTPEDILIQISVCNWGPSQPPGAGRRDRVGRPVRPEHAGDRHRSGGPRSHL